MNEYTSEFLNRDGLRFFVQGWEPGTPPKAAVALVHGQGEHIGRYAHVGEVLTNAGYALMGFDLRGHGRSAGPRGHSPSYSALMEDIEDFLAQVAARYPNLPLFLYGHSMGGNLVINYVLRRKPDIRGVIATGPWLKLAFDLPRSRVLLAKVMNRVFPTLVQASGLEHNALSRDPAVVAAYGADPLVHDKISVRHFSGIYASGLWALEHAGEFSLPLLLMHGTADRVTSEPASREFAHRAESKVEFHPWVGLYHEIHNEPEKARVLETMVDWMNRSI
jgi:alpha-beta hydrolase superfamily lysophospholipase